MNPYADPLAVAADPQPVAVPGGSVVVVVLALVVVVLPVVVVADHEDDEAGDCGRDGSGGRSQGMGQ